METTMVSRRSEFFCGGTLYVRERDDGAPSRTIAGYAIVFGVPSVPLYEDEREVVREVIDASAVTREVLDASDVKMTMFHDRQLILARSKGGAGTLSYSVDKKGVSFEFEAPHTTDGDKALELVRRGDISGCSFAFSTDYNNRTMVERTAGVEADGRVSTLFTVRTITGIYDFTLAADPAYEQTGCEVREIIMREKAEAAARAEALRVTREQENETIRQQVQEMRRGIEINIF